MRFGDIIVMTTQLSQFREDIDRIDSQIVELLGRRFDICTKVAEYKRQNGVSVMQSNRVQEVKDSCKKLAIQNSIDPNFIEKLYSLIIEEACRLEYSHKNIALDNQHDKSSALAWHSRRIDHVAIAVKDLEQAISFFQDKVGFDLVERRDVEGEWSGMKSAVMNAGAITFVLAEGTNPNSNVSQYIEKYGTGIQHIAIEVEDITSVMADLKQRGFQLISGIISSPGLKQIFSTRDSNSGIMLEVIERTEGMDGFTDDNVQELFKAMESQGIY